MRIIVLFDLPVKTKTQQKKATQFRNFLLRDGYYMIQFSVYVRICNGSDAVEKHRKRLYSAAPDNGSIRMITVTEKQFQSMDLILGKPETKDQKIANEQLTIF